VVDDRNEGDFAPDRQLYSYFCPIVAEVVDEGAVKITLSGNVPRGASVEKWCGHHSVIISEHRIVFNVSSENVEMLSDLARAILAIVAPGAGRYSVPSYKYVCPRTAGSLLLRGVLAEHWKCSMPQWGDLAPKAKASGGACYFRMGTGRVRHRATMS